MNTTDPRVEAIAAGFMIAIHREADRIALAEIAIRSDPATAELAALRKENERIKQNHGCARHQGLTQFCAEAEALRAEVQRLRNGLKRELSFWEFKLKDAIEDWEQNGYPLGTCEAHINCITESLNGSPQSKEAENGNN